MALVFFNRKQRILGAEVFKLLPLSFFLIFLCSCTSKEEKIRLYQESVRSSKKTAVEQFVENLPQAVQISQLFLVNIEGNSSFVPVENLSSLYSNSGLSQSLLPGGCLFFSYNIADTKEQVRHFIDSINACYASSKNPPPFLAVDQEGGYVNRLRGITDSFPSEKFIAENLDEESARGLYEKQALQMAELGFNMNLAPVVEPETPENAGFLDTRSFGSLEKVLAYAPIEISAFEKQGIISVLKHFPGNSNTDPHTGLPEIFVTKKQLEEEILVPFKKLLPLSSAVLMSHARIRPEDFTVEGVDYSVPACLSSFWVDRLLRQEWGFEGLILSDDIFMGALADNGFPAEKAAVQAVEAGINVIMLSEKRFAPVARILLKKAEEFPDFAQKVKESVCRVIEAKIKIGLLNLKQIDFDENGKRLKIPRFEVIPLEQN